MTTSLDGLASGLPTQQLLQQLMALEKAPQDRLVAKRDAAKQVVTAYQSLNSKLATVKEAAKSLADPNGWKLMKATSSSSAVATATAGTTALGGSIGITVNKLATAGSVISQLAVPSTASVIATNPLLLAVGGQARGISTLVSNGTTVGAHTIKVTQATTGATKTGGVIAAPVTITAGVNDSLSVDLDTGPATYTIAAGTYTSAAALAAAVQTASNGDLAVSVSDTGALVLATTAEGSAASLKVNASTALAPLNLVADVSAAVGTDGKIEVDGTSTTISNARAGSTAVLGAPAGTVDAVFAGGLRLGTINAKTVAIGDGSLGAVVNAVNGAGLAMTASALQTSPGQYKLQLASTTTGSAGAVTVGAAAFSGIGSLLSLGVAQDASVTVGTGAGAFTTTSSTNSVSGIMDGVTINLVSTGSTTISVNRDAEQLASNVQNMVTQANAALAEIRIKTAFNADTKTAGILSGQYTVRSLQSKITDAIVSTVTTSTLGGGGGAGVSVGRDGSLSFDKAEFLAAYNKNPDDVAALFQRGGTAASTSVSMFGATNTTRPGDYEVIVTTAARRAEVIGGTPAGEVIAADETIDVRVGGASGTVVSYTALAGASLSSIAAGLNAAGTAANAGILATVEAGSLVIRTTGYGLGASFEVKTSTVGANQTGIGTAVYASHTGTNVAGTINGVNATGVGQILTAPSSDPQLGGLSLKITSTTAEVAAALGSLNLGDFTYVPGVAQRLATVGNDAVDTTSGAITAAINGRNSEITALEKQIAAWDTRLAQREANLKKKFLAMETALSQAKAQGAWLDGQIKSLQANSAAANS